MKTPKLPELGQVVEVMRGRDRGLFAVVIGHVPDRFVQIADGDKRKVDKVKIKNVLHVRPMPYVDGDIAHALRNGEKITNANLRYALRRFLASRVQHDEVCDEEGVQRGEG
ncbi:KOW domain-containing RNA-binding protein [Alicyclobacillus cycloheptanicus]|jgi:ribosomal protein L14E/L6E/L27E|uniref:Ribosomal protein L14E/L6E/L27E n=1 Tax=Alicyclobacillus cycloheptanicus TaxID=1457 RepID=A0ABT9XL15_9BACL|nr:KOW domain-containing RNA-binding protein [Alicyclobacillus cycloheptanicus]MDQ0190426.1 ribosomal protein L14E/L6E/L27E [Alicyclobacillus cycloheptanicus]WDM02665.1 KOW domain-containing RNA-binding protein [Alicyclobacillus cycloheptanicus]